MRRLTNGTAQLHHLKWNRRGLELSCRWSYVIETRLDPAPSLAPTPRFVCFTPPLPTQSMEAAPVAL